jgi:hypothetical protein
VQLLYPTPHPAIRDYDFAWNNRLSLATAGEHLRALKETLWCLAEHVGEQENLSVSATRTITELLTASQEHCFEADHHWHALSKSETPPERRHKSSEATR